MELQTSHKAFSHWFKASGCQLLYQRPAAKRLASGAEVGAAVLQRNPLDGAAANRAGFASPVSNLESEMGYAHFAFVLSSPDPLARLEFPTMWPSFWASIPS
jgi:hypothetical protein